MRSAHRRILRAFVDGGGPPAVSTIASEVLLDLGQRDLVHVRHGRICVAYPFTTEATDFWVSVDGVRIHSVCAVDALGVAAMTGKQSLVSALCPVCRTIVEATIAADGLTHLEASHPKARVWASVMDVGACAADSQCKTMRLFCGASHLAAWRATQPDGTGFDLSLTEGIQLGAAIFKPFLASDAGTPRP